MVDSYSEVTKVNNVFMRFQLRVAKIDNPPLAFNMQLVIEHEKKIGLTTCRHRRKKLLFTFFEFYFNDM